LIPEAIRFNCFSTCWMFVSSSKNSKIVKCASEFLLLNQPVLSANCSFICLMISMVAASGIKTTENFDISFSDKYRNNQRVNLLNLDLITVNCRSEEHTSELQSR